MVRATRNLKQGSGLVKESLESNKMKLVWSGLKEVSNTLHFATRTDLKYKKEIELIKQIFIMKMGPKNGGCKINSV
ncbi:hypothetical protein APR41_16780 [Salegentibacter salinarum]|uniref:Uncharacterized protein n=1 Tax=Salegentibacter salinarum TaxID=447422 RepID=A0A2N0TWG5_9FLAO|nr:hypothetical protein APR41_16780 [Salegentibacter salinarum]SKB95889.1 hypothetical protein SAMN05660903_03496 [Salegentibacter salinarum]